MSDLQKWFDQGKALMAQGAFAQAAEAFKQAAHIDPKFPPAVANYGIALAKTGRFEDALEVLNRAVKLAPNVPELWFNLGRAYMDLNRLDECERACAKATQLKPDHVDAHFNRGIALLKAGRLQSGFPEFEWRFKLPGRGSRPMPPTRWTGGDIAGKTILLWGEQGFGDIIQFLRYVPIVAARGARVWVACHGELQTLASRVQGVSAVFPPGSMIPPFDVHAPLMSVGGILNSTLETIPKDVPYIPFDASRSQAWKEKLAAAGKDLKVGLSWGGRVTPTPLRSMPLSMLASLAAVPNVTFVTLQTGPAAEQAKNPPAEMKLIDVSAELRDFADTADLLPNLDLVISIDTAVAHLAGAMARPVFTMLMYVSDWRWMIDRDDSPWYPTMRLFRQTRRNDWTSCVPQVVSALSNFISKGSLDRR